MSIRRKPLSSAEPDVPLSRWKMIETSGGFKHLVGYDSLCTGCVASFLVSFDRKAMRARARSGTVYQLVGNPGSFWDIAEVWDLWCEANSVSVCKDVTELLIAEQAVTPGCLSVQLPRVTTEQRNMLSGNNPDFEIALRKIHELALADGDVGYAYWTEVGQLLRRAAGMQAEIVLLAKELELCRTKLARKTG